VLIYCLTSGGRPERQITVRHLGKVLHTLAVDLAGPPVHVAQEISGLADWIDDRVRGASNRRGHGTHKTEVSRLGATT
jgi:hypothetical protein